MLPKLPKRGEEEKRRRTVMVQNFIHIAEYNGRGSEVGKVMEASEKEVR